MIGHLKTMQAELERLVERDRLPGASVSLVDGADAEVIAVGWADQATARPMDGNSTVLQAASISKVLTGVAVLGLADRGKVDLDQPIGRALTRWRLPPTPLAEDVTIRRILSHIAGLSVPDYPGFAPEARLPTLEESLDGNGGRTEALRIVHAPGGGFEYSGGGFTLLQLMIEEITGTGFSDYMATELLEPLGMTASSFVWGSDYETRIATPLSDAGAALPVYRYEAQAAAGLYTTAADLGRFLLRWMEMPHGVPMALIDRMAAPVADTGRRDGLWACYGLACEIEPLADGTWLAGHHGMNRGWRSLLAAHPARRSGIAVLIPSDAGMAAAEELSLLWFHCSERR